MRDLDDHLYGKDGNHLFRKEDRRLGICPLCDAKDYCYDVGAMGASFWFCRNCITRCGGKNLRKDSNVSLQNAKRAVTAGKSQWDEMQKRYQEKFGRPLMIFTRPKTREQKQKGD